MDIDRHRGCFYGLVVGDALGAPREFKERDKYAEITDMSPVLHFDLSAGSWTDDTSMMLCLAESLTRSGRGPQNRLDQLDTYTRWWREGHNSVNGRCFDIGGTVKTALRAYKFKRNEVAITDDEMFQGNGSLMRLAPIPMMFWHDEVHAGLESALSSETTHANNVCKDACRLFGIMVARALQGKGKEEIIDFKECEGEYEYAKELLPIIRQKYRVKRREDVESSSWILHTLDAVLWAFMRTESFEEGLVLVVNLCGDADTNGAIYGMLAGAHYGFSAIPLRWLDGLQNREKIDGVFEGFILTLAHED